MNNNLPRFTSAGDVASAAEGAAVVTGAAAHTCANAKLIAIPTNNTEARIMMENLLLPLIYGVAQNPV